MSDRQSMLEAQRQKSIREIVVEALDANKGRSSAIQRASLDLGVSDATLYNWCRDLKIDLTDYR